MKNYKTLFIGLSLLMLVGCGNKENIQAEDKNSNENMATEVVEEMQEEIQEEEPMETQESKQGELVFAESISMSPVISIDEEKVKMAVEMGFPSPNTEIDVYEYVPQSSDAIQYEYQENSFELGESLSHKGFEGVEVTYEKIQYTWNDFFDDLDVMEYEKTITVSLKGNSIYEAEVVDENEKYYRYYDENNGLYYVVNDLMLGNYLEEDAELTNARTGNVCNYATIKSLVAPTYNPLVIQSGEEVLSYYITALDEKPNLYMESLLNGRLYKRWIDIEVGIMVKELVFDEEGLLESEKSVVSIVEKDIEQNIFEEPTDVEFIDITLFVYSVFGGDFESLVLGIEAVIPTYETGILLTAEEGTTVTIYTRGLEEMEFKDPLYYSKITLDSCETRTIRNIKDDRFYSICDELKKVEIYDKSCYEQKFFEFEDLGLLNVEITEQGMNYSFYDPNNISVSGLYDVYEYVIEEAELKKINCYNIESITENEPEGDTISYQISLIDYDESVYDERCMDSYEIIDYGEGSFDDGEYIPFWYEE